MAGPFTGTSAQALPYSNVTPRQQLHLVQPATTRTRRNHGAFNLGGQLACVYSTRRGSQCYGVSFELGAGTLTLKSAITSAQARQMARALIAAADAVDQAQGGAA
jgi:hypothetical protein